MAVGIALLAGVVILVVFKLGDARAFARALGRARPGWLAVAAALQALTYVCAGGIWWAVLRRAGWRPSLRRLVLLSVAKLFTDQAVPSGGMAGSLLLVRAIVRRGAPVGLATAALVVNLIGFYASLLFAAALALLWLWVHHHASAPLVVLLALLFGLALVVAAALVTLVRGRGAGLARSLSRVPVVRRMLDALKEAPPDVIGDPRGLAACFTLQLVTIALDGATLAVTLAAVDAPLALPAALACFVFAMVAGIVGVVPGGLGTFEGTSTALLHLAGVPLESALAATLLSRGFTFWLPMIPGVWIFRRVVAQEVSSRAPGA